MLDQAGRIWRKQCKSAFSNLANGGNSSAAQRHLRQDLAIGECPTLEKLEEIEAKIREDLELVMKEAREKLRS